MDPVIVVEVLSASSEARDTGAKPAGYARIPSLRHYLIIDAGAGVVHHRIEDAAAVRTAIARSGTLTLGPPGIALALDTILA